MTKTKAKKTTTKHKPTKLEKLQYKVLTSEDRMALLAEQDLSTMTMRELVEAYFMVHLTTFDLNKDYGAAILNELEPDWLDKPVTILTIENITRWLEQGRERFDDVQNMGTIIACLTAFAADCYGLDLG